MNEQIKEKLNEVLSKCDGKKYPNICKKLSFSEGKELVVNMVYERLVDFPDWDLSNALADADYFLSSLDNE